MATSKALALALICIDMYLAFIYSKLLIGKRKVSGV